MVSERPDSEQQAWAARQLWAGRFVGVLSTHSLDLPGYPFGSLVPYCLDSDGSPLFLLSHLSQHTRNLDADRRCSLNVAESGEGDVQQLTRIAAIGDIEPLPDERGDRYLRYYPQAEFYLSELNFRFYRLRVQRFHVNSGFATARWFGTDRILRPNPLRPDEEAGILDHMNREHPEAVRGYLAATGGLSSESDARTDLVGVDAEGLDLAVQSEPGGRLHRLALPRPIGSVTDARRILIEMAGND